MDMRFMKLEKLDENVLNFPGWIVIDGNLDGSTNIKLGSNTVPYLTKSFLIFDVWMELTLISRSGSTITELYINGIHFCDVN